MANWENLPSTATQLNASNLETLYSLKQGSNNIASNTDLNTLTTPGTYKCISRANAETLTHSPYTVGYFKLIVENISSNDGDHIRQTILTGARNTSVFIRTNDANGWGEWGQLNATKPIRKALFYNSSNTSMTVDLTDSVLNYSYIHISGKGLGEAVVPIHADNQTTFEGVGGWSGSTDVGTYHVKGTISNSGTTLTFTNARSIVHSSENGHTVTTERPPIRIMGIR